MRGDVIDIEWGSNFTDLDWARYMYDAYLVAQASPDPSTQNGAILFTRHGDAIAADCNHFPKGVEYLPERWERPLKYKVIEHAERNSIYAAARSGWSTQGGTLVVPCAACSDCARGIIQAGIARLVRHQQASDRSAKSPGNWLEDILVADQMLKEAGVEIINLSWNFHDGLPNSPHSNITVRNAGEEWAP